MLFYVNSSPRWRNHQLWTADMVARYWGYSKGLHLMGNYYLPLSTKILSLFPTFAYFFRWFLHTRESIFGMWGNNSPENPFGKIHHDFRLIYHFRINLTENTYFRFMKIHQENSSNPTSFISSRLSL